MSTINFEVSRKNEKNKKKLKTTKAQMIRTTVEETLKVRKLDNLPSLLFLSLCGEIEQDEKEFLNK